MDVIIKDGCHVRLNPDGTHGKLFELRVGQPGWHFEAALLNREEALKLIRELDTFVSKVKK